MSDIFSNALNGISNAIHDVGKSSIGQMAEAAALTYFLGPAGAELSIPTAAGVAGGITNLLNGGNIGSALTAGAMGYGLGTLAGPSETGIDAENGPAARGPAPSASDVAKSASGINTTSNVANFVAPSQFTDSGLPLDLQSLESGPVTGTAPTINMPGVAPGSAQYMNAESANPLPYRPLSNQMAISESNLENAATNPIERPTPVYNPPGAAPQTGGNIFSKAYDYLTTPSTPDTTGTAAGKTSFYQDVKNLSPLAKAGLGLGAISLLKAAAKPQPLNYRTPNNQQLRYFGGNQFSGPSNMYQTTAATGGLVALAKGGGIHHFDDGGLSANSSASDIAAAIGADQAANMSQQAIAQQMTNAGVLAPQVISATGDWGAQNAGLVNQLFGNATPAPTPTPTGGIPLGVQMLNQDLTGVTNPTVQQMQTGEANVQAQNQAGNYVNSLLNSGNNQTNVQSFQAGTQADKDALIQKAVQAAQTEFGGNNAQSQAAIAQLMNEWGVNPSTLGSAINVPVSTVQADYNAATAGLGASAPYYAALTANTQASGIDLVAIQQLASQAGLDNPKSYTSMAQVLNDIAAKKAAVTKVTPTPTPTPATTLPGTIPMGTMGTTTTQNGTVLNTYTAPGTNTPIVLNPVNRTTQNVSTPTDIATAPAGALPSGVGGNNASINPNGTISQNLNLPSRPAGGYTSMAQLAKAYTQGGGSTGYTNPAAPATTTDLATQHILDILSGKIPASKVPYTPTGEISKPYYTSVMGMTENPVYTISQPTIFDPTSKTYITNPNYDQNFSATADYIGAYSPGYKGAAVPGLSQKTLDYLNQHGTTGYGTSTTANAAASAPTTNASGQLVVKGQTYPTGSYIGGNGHLMVPDGGQNDNGQPTYNDLGIVAAGGGLMGLAAGGMSGMNVGHLGGYSDGGRLLRGPGDGVSDSIPATIGSTNPEPARLADGEFVVPARIVSELGNGSTEAGARQLYKMMDRIQHARRKTVGKEAVATNTNAHQYLPA